MGFINRGYELDYLRRCYREEKSPFIVLYGKRRVDKTSLMKEFANGRSWTDTFQGARTTCGTKRLPDAPHWKGAAEI
jgi:AAA+ ATPase superfamily predicted ATPase